MKRAATKPATHANNPAGIARALGIDAASPRVLAEVEQWMARPDFPKRRRTGYLLEEVGLWYAAYLKETPLFKLDDLDALRIAREKAYIQEFTEGKALEKFSDEGRAVLAKHGLIEAATHTVTVGGVAVPALAKVMTQKAVLAEMQRHYAGKLAYEITQQNISDWHGGKNLPDPQAPPAPHKDGNYFVLARWYQWFDQYVLPHWNIDGAGTSTFAPGELTQLRRENEREEILHAKFQRECEQAKWIRKVDLAPALEGAVRLWLEELDRVESAIPRKLDEVLKHLVVAEDLRMRVMDEMRAACAGFNDGLRSAIQNRLMGVK